MELMQKSCILLMLLILLPGTPVSVQAEASTPDYALNYTTLNAPGASFTDVNGINDKSEMVGCYSDSSSIRHGFMLIKDQYTILDAPGAKGDTVANAINSQEQIVGEFDDASKLPHGFLLTKGVYTEIVDPHGTLGTRATGINDTGQIVGTYIDKHNKTHGFLFSKGAYTTIDAPKATAGTFPSGISAQGLIYGTYFTESGTYGFVLQDNHYKDLTLPDATQTMLTSIYGSGIGGSYYDSANKEHGFLIGVSGIITLDGPDQPAATMVNCINTQGQIVGVYIDGMAKRHGFLLNRVKATNHPASGVDVSPPPDTAPSQVDAGKSSLQTAHFAELYLAAVIKDDAPAVKALLDQGMPPNQKDSSGYPQIFEATLFSASKVLSLLLNAGADVNVQNSKGDTPLVDAVVGGKKVVVDMLLAKKPDLTIETDAGYTVMNYALLINKQKATTDSAAILKALQDVNAPLGDKLQSIRSKDQTLVAHVAAFSVDANSGIATIIGTVTNVGKQHYTYVEVKAKFVDDTEVLIDTGLDNVQSLDPGETWKFKISTLKEGATGYKLQDVSGHS